jgi:hypothetical protein
MCGKACPMSSLHSRAMKRMYAFISSIGRRFAKPPFPVS